MSGPVVVAERGREGRKDESPEPEPESRTTESLDREDQEEGEEEPSCHADAEGARAHMRCYDNLRGIITSGQQRASATDGGLAWDRGVRHGALTSSPNPRQLCPCSVQSICNLHTDWTDRWSSLGELGGRRRMTATGVMAGGAQGSTGQGRTATGSHPDRQTQGISRPCYRVDYTIGTIQIARRVYWPTA